MSNEDSWTVTNSFLHGCQNWKKGPEEQFKENPFSGGKHSPNFQGSEWTVFLLLLAEMFTTVVKTATYVASEGFG